MTNFHVGQKVVSLGFKGVGGTGCEILPVKGAVFTVRDATIGVRGYQLVRLVEVVNKKFDYTSAATGLPAHEECWYVASRFRPVASKPTSMDIIRAIVLDPSKPIPDDPREPKVIPVPEYHPDMGRI